MKNKKEKEKIITTEEEAKPSETLTSIVEVNVAKRTLAAFLDLLIGNGSYGANCKRYSPL